MDEARLFMVRVWHGAQDFRASVRRVEDDRVHMFHAVDDLARFFAHGGLDTGTDEVPAAGARCAPDPRIARDTST